MKEHFKGIVKSEYDRYKMPNNHEPNLDRKAAMRAGVTLSITVNMHGKGLSSYLLNIDI